MPELNGGCQCVDCLFVPRPDEVADERSGWVGDSLRQVTS
jgi:hypothetical protein